MTAEWSYALLVVGGAMMAAGCATLRRAEPPMEARFELLWNRDLSAFEQRVAVERHTGRDDAWTRVGEAWLDLANCRPVRSRSFPAGHDRTAAFTHATVVLEDVRRRFRAVSSETKGRTLPEEIRGSAFFEREASAIPADQVRWPTDEERWPDEVPAPVDVEHQCATLDEQLSDESPPPDPFGDDANIPRESSVHAWRLELFAAVDRVVRRYRGLSDDSQSGATASATHLARYYGAASAHRWASVYEDDVSFPDEITDAMKSRLTPEFMRARATDYLGELVDQEEIAGLSNRQTARVHLLYALVQERAGEIEQARKHLARADQGGLSTFNKWSARYLRLRLLARAAAWKEAADVADPIPPRDSRYYEAFVYRAAQALRRNGEEDRFLKVGKQVFRHRAPQSHPFLRALYAEVIESLAQYPFDPRIIELLEELGPRSRLYARVEDFARRALDRGRTDSARAAAEWLLRRHDDARYEPRYRGILALAAFLEDQPEEFRERIREVAARPDQLKGAVGPQARARMFAHADAELAQILRETLPVMAEWGNSERAQRRREEWLSIVVEETQRFLRQTESTMAREPLLELYRLASELLEKHPRGYAERVGDEQRGPLVLGTVRLGVGDLDKHEPRIVFRFPEPYSLTLVPRDQKSPSEWPRRWPEGSGSREAQGEEGEEREEREEGERKERGTVPESEPKRGRSMRRWIGRFVVLAAALWGAPVAAESGAQCENRVDCDRGMTCIRGRCTDVDRVLDFAPANAACGTDRRCRLERLARRNRARRHAEKLEEEEYVENLLERRRDDFVDEHPRVKNPWVVDYRISRLGALGVGAGYTFDGHMRAEIQLVRWNADVDVFSGEGELRGSQPLTFIMPGFFYYFFDSAITPFLGGSFLYARGEMTPSGLSSGDTSALGTEYHALSLQGGADLQVEQGVHVKTGLAYRPLIYNQARLAPGEYDAPRRRMLEDWYEQMVRIDFVFQVGWSF